METTLYTLKEAADGYEIHGPNDFMFFIKDKDAALAALEKLKPVPGPLLDPDRKMSPTPFTVRFATRGHGHGDYAVLDADGRLVAELHTIYQRREAILLAASWDMLEALKSIKDPSEQVLAAIKRAT